MSRMTFWGSPFSVVHTSMWYWIAAADAEDKRITNPQRQIAGHGLRRSSSSAGVIALGHRVLERLQALGVIEAVLGSGRVDFSWTGPTKITKTHKRPSGILQLRRHKRRVRRRRCTRTKQWLACNAK